MNKIKTLLGLIIAFILTCFLTTLIILTCIYKTYWSVVLLLTYVLLTEIVVGFYILNSQKEKIALSRCVWLIMIILFPGLGTIFFFMFATRPMFKYGNEKKYLHRQTKFLQWENDVNNVVTDDKLDCFKYSANYCFNPILINNQIKNINNNTDFFQETLKLIQEARKFIFIHSFIYCKKSFFTNILFTELIKKVRQGINVYLLYDWWGIKANRRLSEKTMRKLKKYGIQVGVFNPKWITAFKGSTNYRLHTKFLIIDNKKSICGGSNIADEYLSMSKNNCLWEDFNMVCTGPIVNSMTKFFCDYWLYFTDTSINQRDRQNFLNNFSLFFTKYDFPPSQIKMQIVNFEPNLNELHLKCFLKNCFSLAKKSIKFVTPYFAASDDINNILIAQQLNGVNIEIITPEYNNRFIKIINYQNYQKCLSQKIKIYEYNGFIHSKYFIIDDRYIIVGSANFDIRSMFLNYEIQYILDDHVFLRSMNKLFEKTKKNCVLITTDKCDNFLTKRKKIFLKFLNIFGTLY